MKTTADGIGALPGRVVGSPRSRPGRSAREASVSAPAHLLERRAVKPTRTSPRRRRSECPGWVLRPTAWLGWARASVAGVASAGQRLALGNGMRP